MPLRYIPPGSTYERDPLPGDSAWYEARPVLVAEALAFYTDEQFGVERPAQRAPDGFHIMKESTDGNRTALLLKWNLSDARVEVSYVMKDRLPTEVKARPLTPDESYRMALDGDDDAIARGSTIYN